MAAEDDEEIDALFASDSDDDDFNPAAPAEEEGDAEPEAAESEPDDYEDEQPAPKPRKPLETAATRFKDVEEGLADVGSDSDEGAIVREATPEVELGPPLELSAPFVPRPATESLWLIRTSNIMHLEVRPFDPATFDKEEETYEDEVTGEVKVRLRDESTIRWRIVPDGEGGQRYESNARFVRWSDGSRQLLLGDEVLDVAEQDVASDQHYLFVRHQGLIQGQAQLTRRMAVRPASLASKAHRRLTAALDRRHVKFNRVQRTVTVLDPKKAKSDLEKDQEARIRSREGLARKQEKAMRKYDRTPSSSRGASGLSAAYLEAELDEEEDYEHDDGGDGMTATERARAALARPRRIDEAAEAEAERRLASAKREAPPAARPSSAKRSRPGLISSDEEDDLSDFIEKDMSEDEEEEERPKAKKSKPNRRHINLSDSDDD